MNIPMSLTLIRILAIPVVILLYLLPFPWAHPVAAVIFLLAALTDWLDGVLARALSQTTKLGAFLDPVADKLLVTMTLVIILAKHALPTLAIPIAIIIGREIAISALREWMSEIGKRTGVKVMYISKLKTVLQMLAVVLLLWYYPGVSAWVEWFGPILLWLAAALTVWSMGIYLRVAWPDLTLSKEKE